MEESLSVMEGKVLYCQCCFHLKYHIPCILGNIGNKPVAMLVCGNRMTIVTGIRRNTAASFLWLTAQVGLELKIYIIIIYLA